MDKSVFQNMTVLLEIEQISKFRDERAIDHATLIVSEIVVNDKDIRQGPMDNIEAYVVRELIRDAVVLNQGIHEHRWAEAVARARRQKMRGERTFGELDIVERPTGLRGESRT